MNDREIRLAEKTFLALINPYGSVERTYPLALRNCKGSADARYVGIKDRVQIPETLLEKLEEKSFYLHTLDAQSLGGRAVDIRLKNPVSGRPMTGSSSGTAVNVFIGINDLGIGTDGGGSVLAPAMSLNLYGYINPQICKEELSRFPESVSTDGLRFRSSIGFMARDLKTVEDAVWTALDLSQEEASGKEAPEKISLCVQDELYAKFPEEIWEGYSVSHCEFPPFSASRTEQISFLTDKLAGFDFVISSEGPVDSEGFGDSVFGHFDESTKEVQARANKGLIKVANMVGAAALAVPDSEFAKGSLITGKADKNAQPALFELARRFPAFQDDLTERYFRTFEKYIPIRYGEPV